MKKVIQTLFISIVLTFCLIPVFFFEKEEAVSVVDNDFLPAYTGLRDRASFQNYFSKRIGFRENMIRAYTDLNAFIFRVLDYPNCFFGRENYTFINENESTFDEYHEDFIHYLLRLKHYLYDRNIPFYVVLNPSKNTIYEEYLYSYQKKDKSWANSFIQGLEDGGINVLDNRNILINEKGDHLLFDQKNDPYHWNDWGELAGTNALFKMINQDFNEIEPIHENDYSVSQKINKYTLNNALTINETTDTLEFNINYEDIAQEWISKIDISETFNDFHYYVTDNKNAPKALVFEGSYYLSNDRNKFLIPRFSEIVAVHNYENIFHAKDYVELFSPDLVIFEVAEYTIGEYFFGQWHMQNNLLDY